MAYIIMAGVAVELSVFWMAVDHFVHLPISATAAVVAANGVMAYVVAKVVVPK